MYVRELDCHVHERMTLFIYLMLVIGTEKPDERSTHFSGDLIKEDWAERRDLEGVNLEDASESSRNAEVAELRVVCEVVVEPCSVLVKNTLLQARGLHTAWI
jgi:hypothetical protein